LRRILLNVGRSRLDHWVVVERLDIKENSIDEILISIEKPGTLNLPPTLSGIHKVDE